MNDSFTFDDDDAPPIPLSPPSVRCGEIEHLIAEGMVMPVEDVRENIIWAIAMAPPLVPGHSVFQDLEQAHLE